MDCPAAFLSYSVIPTERSDEGSQRGLYPDSASPDDIMPTRRPLWVYILASRTRVLYAGVTNDMERRLAEHREGKPGSFAARYQAYRLVHLEEFSSARDAIAREKQIKAWRPEKKRRLIERANPEWRDLSAPEADL